MSLYTLACIIDDAAILYNICVIAVFEVSACSRFSEGMSDIHCYKEHVHTTLVRRRPGEFSTKNSRLSKLANKMNK